MRTIAITLTTVVTLSIAPAASAWTQLGGGVQSTVVPSLLVTQAGSELASFESASAGTVSVSRNHGTPRVVAVSGGAAGRTQLVQQPSGAIQLYFPNAQGVARMTSADDGLTWTGPVQTRSHTVGGVQSAAVLPDGTPLFTQDGTDFVDVFRGLDGETVKNVYTRCCGYHESLAVDSAGLVQIALYSNADPDGATVYQPLDADLTPRSSTPLKPVAEHEAPLVADRSGTTFLAWAPGYPTAAGLHVVPFRNGSPAGDGVSFGGAFSGSEPHMALSVDAQDRLWAVWTEGGTLRAARSRSHGMHFGATVSAALPGAAYELAAVALGGNPGAVDVVVGTGPALMEQQLHPGLSVRVFRKGRVRWAQALDDGVGVAGATFTAGGRRLRADAGGRIALTGLRRGSAKAAAPGYVGASFRIP